MKNEKIPSGDQYNKYYSLIKQIVKNEYLTFIASDIEFELNYFDNLIDIDEDAQNAVNYLSKIKNCEWDKARNLVLGDCVWKFDEFDRLSCKENLPQPNKEKIKLIKENYHGFVPYNPYTPDVLEEYETQEEDYDM